MWPVHKNQRFKPPLKLAKKVNLTITPRFLHRVVVWVQIWFPGSVRCGRPTLRTSNGESDSTTLAYNSRLRAISTFLSSDSESTPKLVSLGYLMDLSYVELRFVSDFGRVSNPSDFEPRIQNWTVLRHTKVWKFHHTLWTPNVVFNWIWAQKYANSPQSQVISQAGKIWLVVATHPISELGIKLCPHKPKLVPIPLPYGENDTNG